MKDEIMNVLDKKGWEEDKIAIPDPTLLDRMVRRRK
jgi:hypothetical protein